MHRRTFLVGASALLCGCSGLGVGRDRSSVPAVTPAPVPTATANSLTGQARFDGVVCPRIDNRTDQSVCSHTLSDGDGLRFVPDRSLVGLADDRFAAPLEVRLSWTLPGSLTVFAGSWYLLEQVAGEWRIFETAGRRRPIVELDSGEERVWVVDEAPRDVGPSEVAVAADFSPGRYALVVRAVGGQTQLNTECVALFDVVDHYPTDA